MPYRKLCFEILAVLDVLSPLRVAVNGPFLNEKAIKRGIYVSLYSYWNDTLSLYDTYFFGNTASRNGPRSPEA